MPTTSNFGWTTPADTDLVKDGAAAIRTLGNGIDTSFLDLKGGTTDQVLAKNSNTDLDFKWVTSDDANAIQNAIVDAKGDLISATAADTPARLAVGANGTVLTADSAEATGLKWATPASGGMTLLSTFVPSSSTGNAFTGLSGYKHLLLTWVNLIGSSSSTTFGIRLNNSSSSIYHDRYLMNATPEGQTSTFITADFSMFIRNADAPGIGTAPRGFLWIYDYASTVYAKSYSGGSSYYDGGFGARLISNVTGIFNTTSAITSVDIVRTAGSGTFSTANDGVIKLYGVS